MNQTQTKDNAIFLTLRIGSSITVRVLRPFVRLIGLQLQIQPISMA